MSRGLLFQATCLVCRHRKESQWYLWGESSLPAPTIVSGDRVFLCSPGWLGNCSPPACASWCWDYKRVSPRNHFSLPFGPCSDNDGTSVFPYSHPFCVLASHANGMVGARHFFLHSLPQEHLGVQTKLSVTWHGSDLSSISLIRPCLP